MGCSNSNALVTRKKEDVVVDSNGADEYPETPDHGANELPPMEHEDDFEPDL